MRSVFKSQNRVDFDFNILTALKGWVGQAAKRTGALHMRITLCEQPFSKGNFMRWKFLGVLLALVVIILSCGDKNNGGDKNGVSYIITFNPNGGTVEYESDTTGANGKLASLPTPEYEGREFNGWFTVGSSGAKVDTGTVFTRNTTVYAQWTKKNTAGIDTAKTDTTGIDTTGTDTTGTDTTGIDTTGTDTTGIDTTGTDTTGIDTTQTPDTYIIKFEANGGAVTPDTGVTGTGGKLSALPTPDKTGCTFDGWYTAETGGTKIDTSNVYSADDTIYAQWTINKYRVTFNSQGGGAVAPQNDVAYNTKAAEPATSPTRAGYTFGGWYRDAAGDDVWDFAADVVTSAITLYAKWTLDIYTITFDANGGAAVSPASAKTGEGWKLTLASLPAPTKNGYKFRGWWTAVTGGALVTTATVFSADATLYARWIETFTDVRDGQVYAKTTIGTQTWMAENLNYDTAGGACYEYDPENCDTYGRLYDWYTAAEACPAGWHLPNNQEWRTLLEYAGGTLQIGEGNMVGTALSLKLKAASGWGSVNGTDDYGFAALPGGRFSAYFRDMPNRANWWVYGNESNNDAPAPAWSMRFNDGNGTTIYYFNNNAKEDMHSVRCVQD
jgi:uncharacterized protein (TIGR02145 family)/uncharacterized repeat protein (TIGR02543 family)